MPQWFPFHAYGNWGTTNLTPNITAWAQLDSNPGSLAQESLPLALTPDRLSTPLVCESLPHDQLLRAVSVTLGPHCPDRSTFHNSDSPAARRSSKTSLGESWHSIIWYEATPAMTICQSDSRPVSAISSATPGKPISRQMDLVGHFPSVTQWAVHSQHTSRNSFGQHCGLAPHVPQSKSPYSGPQDCPRLSLHLGLMMTHGQSPCARCPPSTLVSDLPCRQRLRTFAQAALLIQELFPDVLMARSSSVCSTVALSVKPSLTMTPLARTSSFLSFAPIIVTIVSYNCSQKLSPYKGRYFFFLSFCVHCHIPTHDHCCIPLIWPPWHPYTGSQHLFCYCYPNDLPKTV